MYFRVWSHENGRDWIIGFLDRERWYTIVGTMKYSTFEELPVWKAAIEFALQVFEFTNKGDFRGLGDTKNQLERAALSISNQYRRGV
jgi:hypothetical protein